MQAMRPAAICGVVVVLISATLVAGSTGPQMDVALPAEVADGTTLSLAGAHVHAKGQALGSTIVWALDNVRVREYSQVRGPCALPDPAVCPPAQGGEQAPLELETATVTITTQAISSIAIISGSSDPALMRVNGATLGPLGDAKRVEPPSGAVRISDYSDEIRKDTLVVDAASGEWSLLANSVVAIPMSATVTIRWTEDDGSETEHNVQTGYSWRRDTTGNYYELHLLRIEGSGPVPISWTESGGDQVVIAPTPPFHLSTTLLSAPGGGSGTLADGTDAPSGPLALRDVEADVLGVFYPTSGPPSIKLAFTPTSLPPPPADDDATDWGRVSGTAAAASLAVLGGAWYWPRLRYGLTVLALPMYSRIQKSELLQHGVRERLYEAIKGEPGIHAHALAARTGLGWGTTVYHLRLLEKNKLVTSTRHGRFRRFYPAAGFLAAKREVMAVLQNETSNAVARHVLKHPGENQSALCAALSISPSLANWHVKRLVEAGLVKKEQRGRSVFYFPGPGWDEISTAQDTAGTGAGLGPAEA